MEVAKDKDWSADAHTYLIRTLGNVDSEKLEAVCTTVMEVAQDKNWSAYAHADLIKALGGVDSEKLEAVFIQVIQLAQDKELEWMGSRQAHKAPKRLSNNSVLNSP